MRKETQHHGNQNKIHIVGGIFSGQSFSLRILRTRRLLCTLAKKYASLKKNNFSSILSPAILYLANLTLFGSCYG